METAAIQFYKILYQEGGKRVFKDLGIRAPSFDVAIQNPGKFLSGDRENVFITIAEVHPEPQPNKAGKMIDRYLKIQKYLPFDIDDIDTEKVMETLACVRRSLGLSDDQGYAICTGNGLQIFIGLKQPITTVEYFEETRPYYKALCEKINEGLNKVGLPGHSDDSVFKNTQVVRLPNTINRKPGREAREAMYLNGTVKAIDFDLKERAPKPKEDFLDRATFKKIEIGIDTDAVLSGCDYLKYAKEKAATLPEPEWYAALGILAFLPKGRDLCHQYSRGYAGYSYEETEEKIEQILKNQTGPRTCENIDQIWNKCKACPNFGECKTPALIKGPNFIESAARGFRKIKYKIVTNEETGEQQRIQAGTGAVDYDDFLKYFKREYPYRAVNSNLLFTYNGKHWEQKHQNFVSHVAEKVIKNDTPKRSECGECQHKILRSDYTNEDWLAGNNLKHLVNFQNGVLNIKTLELKEHDKKYGFFNVFPYSYTEAECPKTDEVLATVLEEDPEAIEFFWRYLGACFDPFGEIQKSLFIIGQPATGKSTIAKVFDTVFPTETRSGMKLNEICNDNLFKFRAYQLYKKYVNVGDEGVPDHALDMSNFKNVVSCGDITYEKKGQDAFTFKCTTKFIVLANNYVKMRDASKDFARKFEVLTTNRTIPESEQDSRYQDLWIPGEATGIAFKAIQKYREMLSEKEKTGKYDLKITEKMVEGKKFALDSSSDGDEFFDRVVYTGDEKNKVSMKELYSEYKEHAQQNGHKTSYSRKAFTTRLRTRYATRWGHSWDSLYGNMRFNDNRIQKGLKCVKLLDEDGLDSTKEDY